MSLIHVLLSVKFRKICLHLINYKLWKENENQKKQLTFLLKSNIIYRISLH